MKYMINYTSGRKSPGYFYFRLFFLPLDQGGKRGGGEEKKTQGKIGESLKDMYVSDMHFSLLGDDMAFFSTGVYQNNLSEICPS